MFRSDTSKPASLPFIFSSGMFAGSINSFLVAPVEMIRNQQISHPNQVSFFLLILFILFHSFSSFSSFQSMLTVIKNVLKPSPDVSYTQSIRSIYRGLTVTISRDALGMGAYFSAYAYFSSLLSPIFASGQKELASKQNKTILDRIQYMVPLLLAGSASGIAFWAVALPLDTLKSRIQTDVKLSYTQAIRELVRRPGSWMPTYPIAFMRGIPSAATTLATYQVLSEWLFGKNPMA